MTEFGRLETAVEASGHMDLRQHALGMSSTCAFISLTVCKQRDRQGQENAPVVCAITPSIKKRSDSTSGVVCFVRLLPSYLPQALAFLQAGGSLLPAGSELAPAVAGLLPAGAGLLQKPVALLPAGSVFQGARAELVSAEMGLLPAEKQLPAAELALFPAGAALQSEGAAFANSIAAVHCHSLSPHQLN